MYILAANILGPRQKPIPPMVEPQPLSYKKMRANLEIFANFVVKFETAQVKAPFSIRGARDPKAASRSLLGLGTLYFCIPGNDKLDKYWDIVEDRLFKLRNCMNIEGVVRQLPLFQPPIDPALLVRAAAAGVDIASALDGLNAPLPVYRYKIMVRKALELTGMVQSMQSAMLKAQERKDAAELAELESEHEQQILQRVVDVRKQGVAEAEVERKALEEGLAGLEIEAAYLKEVSQKLENEFEKAEQDARREGIKNMAIAQGAQLVGKILRAIPNFKLGVVAIGPESTVQTGGQQLSEIALAAAEGALAVAASSQASAEMTAVNAQRHRVQQELQAKANQLVEIKKQYEQQIVAATIREQAADARLRDAKFDLRQAKEKSDWLREHFTSKQLYSWIISELSSVYFRAYRCAFDMAKSAERAWQFERQDSKTSFIQFTYWDSMKKGLLAADKLRFDIQRLDSAWLERDKRYLELTKSISLRTHFPLEFLKLKAKGACEIDIAESLFDADHPGHYFRRIKTASMNVIVGEKQLKHANASMTLLKNSMRKEGISRGDYTQKNSDPRFLYDLVPVQKRATSSGIDDAGLFELRFDDERYLPFEGAGAISKWRIEMLQRSNEFDMSRISDVVLKLRFTARDGGTALANAALKSLDRQWGQQAGGSNPLYHLVDLEDQFPAAWQAIKKAVSKNPIEHNLHLDIDAFPARFGLHEIKVNGLDLFVCLSRKVNMQNFAVQLTPPKGSSQMANTWTPYYKSQVWLRNSMNINTGPGTWKLQIKAGSSEQIKMIKKMVFVFRFTVSAL